MNKSFALLLSLLILSGIIWQTARAAPSTQEPYPQPGLDRLAVPVLPDNPSQSDFGRLVYFYNCMPCHGDVGQGLTDEWRLAWVEDHQNCWERGCHGGRQEDEGFPLPKAIPALIQAKKSPTILSEPAHLYAYLKSTHPPQRPGILEDNDYWAVTAFILHENKLIGDYVWLGENNPAVRLSTGQSIIYFLAITFLVAGALIFQAKFDATPPLSRSRSDGID
jgi:mono/diheme cytochrome c family protein